MFFHYTATTEIYTYGHSLSLHDARPILVAGASAGICPPVTRPDPAAACVTNAYTAPAPCPRSGGFVMWSARRTISSLPDRRYVDAYDPCASCACDGDGADRVHRPNRGEGRDLAGESRRRRGRCRDQDRKSTRLNSSH